MGHLVLAPQNHSSELFCSDNSNFLLLVSPRLPSFHDIISSFPFGFVCPSSKNFLTNSTPSVLCVDITTGFVRICYPELTYQNDTGHSTIQDFF